VAARAKSMVTCVVLKWAVKAPKKAAPAPTVSTAGFSLAAATMHNHGPTGTQNSRGAQGMAHDEGLLRRGHANFKRHQQDLVVYGRSLPWHLCGRRQERFERLAHVRRFQVEIGTRCDNNLIDSGRHIHENGGHSSM
jgi:hypothetical protein